MKIKEIFAWSTPGRWGVIKEGSDGWIQKEVFLWKMWVSQGKIIYVLASPFKKILIFMFIITIIYIHTADDIYSYILNIINLKYLK